MILIYEGEMVVLEAAKRWASGSLQCPCYTLLPIGSWQRVVLGHFLGRVQESHVSPVTAMAFNQVDPECSNLVATIGGNQVNLAIQLHNALPEEHSD